MSLSEVMDEMAAHAKARRAVSTNSTSMRLSFWVGWCAGLVVGNQRGTAEFDQEREPNPRPRDEADAQGQGTGDR